MNLIKRYSEILQKGVSTLSSLSRKPYEAVYGNFFNANNTPKQWIGKVKQDVKQRGFAEGLHDLSYPITTAKFVRPVLEPMISKARMANFKAGRPSSTLNAILGQQDWQMANPNRKSPTIEQKLSDILKNDWNNYNAQYQNRIKATGSNVGAAMTSFFPVRETPKFYQNAGIPFNKPGLGILRGKGPQTGWFRPFKETEELKTTRAKLLSGQRLTKQEQKVAEESSLYKAMDFAGISMPPLKQVKGVKKLPKSLEPLAKEARKYKSAEEFRIALKKQYNPVTELQAFHEKYKVPVEADMFREEARINSLLGKAAEGKSMKQNMETLYGKEVTDAYMKLQNRMGVPPVYRATRFDDFGKEVREELAKDYKKLVAGGMDKTKAENKVITDFYTQATGTELGRSATKGVGGTITSEEKAFIKYPKLARQVNDVKTGGFITTNGKIIEVDGHPETLSSLGFKSTDPNSNFGALNRYLDKGGIRTVVAKETGDINLEIHKTPTPEQMRQLTNLPDDVRYFVDLYKNGEYVKNIEVKGGTKGEALSAISKTFPISQPQGLGGVGEGAKKIVIPSKLQTKTLQPVKTQPEIQAGLVPKVPPEGGITGAGKKSLTTIIPPGQKQKSLLETIQESQTITKPLSEKVAGLKQGYTPITHKETLSNAKKVFSETPNIAEQRVLSNEPPTAEKLALGEMVIKKYESQAAKIKNIDEKNAVLDSAIGVVESLDKQLREAGQFVEAVKTWDKLSPAGMLRAVERAAQKNKFALGEDVKRIVYDKMLGIQKIKDAGKKNDAILELLNYVAEKMPATKGEMFEAYRYQNMLSGWKTQERNIYQNLFNTFVTRPADLAVQGVYDFAHHPFNPVARDVQLSDAPRYMKNVFTSLPNSLAAAKEAFKRGYSPNKLDLGRADTTIDLLRKQNVPKVLTAVPRAMEAQDRFFSSMIATGEKARLMKKGISEEIANSKAIEIAEEYLMRAKLGSQEGKPIFSKALDSLGSLILQGRKLPVLGKAWGWFVPFVTTPINAAKFAVEHSPLGLVGGNYSTQQIARATTGSIVTAIGAMLAAQGKTSWDIPKNTAGYSDKKAKDAFYAGGRKKWSVKIGDKWVPMWYFGPFALALAIPAAVKYFNDESPTALTDSQVTKLGKVSAAVSKMVFSQTPLSNTAGFLAMLDGDTDINMGSLIGFSGGQAVPITGFLRNVAQLLDPVYRKTSGVKESIMAGIPGLSQNLKPYTTPTGEESKRLPVNAFLPYDLGQIVPEYETSYQQRTQKLQQNAVTNQLKKQAEETNQPQQSGNTIITPEGKTIDLSFQPISPTLTGQTELDKKIVSKFNSDITKKSNDVVALWEMGKIDQNEAEKQLNDLKALKESATLPKIKTAKAKKPKKVTFKKLAVPKIKTIKLKSPKLPKIKTAKLKKRKLKKIKLTKVKLKGRLT